MPQHLLGAALHNHLLSGPGADGVAGPGVDRRAGDAAAGALLAVVSAGGLSGVRKSPRGPHLKFVQLLQSVSCCLVSCIWGLSGGRIRLRRLIGCLFRNGDPHLIRPGDAHVCPAPPAPPREQCRCRQAEPKSAQIHRHQNVVRGDGPHISGCRRSDTVSCSVSMVYGPVLRRFSQSEVGGCHLWLRCISLKEMRSVARVTPLRFSQPSGMGMA